MLEWTFLKEELRVMAKMAWPMTVTQGFYILIFPTALAFCGSLGKEKMDSASLAISLYQMLVVSAASGLRWGCLPYFAQALGSNKPHRVGVHLQRAIITGSFLIMISIGLICNSGNILIHIAGQIPHIAADSEQYLMIMIPGCISLVLFRILIGYTDSMRIVVPTMVVHGVSSLFNFVMHYIVMTVLGYGILGSAVCISSTMILMTTLQLTYICCSGVYKSTWKGWSVRCLFRWSDFLKGAIPSMGLQLFQIFSLEIANFLAGLESTSTLAAQSIIFQIVGMCSLLPVGSASAVISRVSFHLGHGDSVPAKTVFYIGLMFLAIAGILSGIIGFLLRYEIPKLFSADLETIDIFLKCMPFVSVYLVFIITGFACVAGMRAANYQAVAMVNTLIAYYVICIPIGASLMFAANWGLRGLWIGYTCAIVFHLSFGLTVMLKIVNWSKLSKTISQEAGAETDFELSKSVVESDNTDETQTLLKIKNKNRKNKSDEEKRLHISRQVKPKIVVFIIGLCLMSASIIFRIFVPPIVPGKIIRNNTAVVINSTATSMMSDVIFN